MDDTTTSKRPIELAEALGMEFIPKIDPSAPVEQRMEMGYRAFAQMTGKHRRGWAQKLSQVLGVHANTLKRWRELGEWDLRFAGEMAALHHDLERTAQAVLFAAAGKVAERVVEVVETGMDRDAISAAKLWSEMTGVTVRKPIQPVSISNNILVAPERVQAFQTMSDEELFGTAKQLTQDQLDQSLRVRAGRKQLPNG